MRLVFYGVYDNDNINSYNFLDTKNIHEIVDYALRHQNAIQPLVWIVSKCKKDIQFF